MREVVGDGRVNIAETERRKALRNLLGGGAQFEMMNDRIQTNARILHSNGAVFGDGKRNAECLFKGDHKRVDYTSRSGCAEELRSEEQKAGSIRISDCELRNCGLLEQGAMGRRQTAGSSESERSLAAKDLLDGCVSTIDVDNQIANASSDDVFCTVVYAPDGLTIRGALADRDEALGRTYIRLMGLFVGRGE